MHSLSRNLWNRLLEWVPAVNSPAGGALHANFHIGEWIMRQLTEGGSYCASLQVSALWGMASGRSGTVTVSLNRKPYFDFR